MTQSLSRWLNLFLDDSTSFSMTESPSRRLNLFLDDPNCISIFLISNLSAVQVYVICWLRTYKLLLIGKFYVSFSVHLYPVTLTLIQPLPLSASLHSLSLSISFYLHHSLALFISFYLSIFFLPLSPSLSRSIYLTLLIFLSLSLSISLYIYKYISISLFFLTSLCFTMFTQLSQFQWIALTIFNPTQW